MRLVKDQTSPGVGDSCRAKVDHANIIGKHCSQCSVAENACHPAAKTAELMARATRLRQALKLAVMLFFSRSLAFAPEIELITALVRAVPAAACPCTYGAGVLISCQN